MNRQRFKKNYLIPIYIALFVITLGHGVLAQSNLPGVDIQIQDVAAIIEGIACWLMRVVLALVVIFLILSGVSFLTARGNPEKVGKAKENFKWVIIGIAVVLGVNVIIATVGAFITNDASFINPFTC